MAALRQFRSRQKFQFGMAGCGSRDNMEMSHFHEEYVYEPDDDEDDQLPLPVVISRSSLYSLRVSDPIRPQASRYPPAGRTNFMGPSYHPASGIYCDDHRYSYSDAAVHQIGGNCQRAGPRYGVPRVSEPMAATHLTPRSSCSSDTRNQELVIFLKNEVAVNVDLEEFPSCADILGAVVTDPQLELGPSAEDVFQLWLVSPLLEVQLKPHHRPLAVRQQWPQLLTKFTDACPKEAEADEPIVTLRRNVFYSKKDERNLRDRAALELLQAEARCNVLDGRYPCSPADAFSMAALQAKMELGKYDPDVHTPDYFRCRLDRYLPYPYCSRPLRSLLRIGGSKSGPEHHLVTRFRNVPDNKSGCELAEDYLRLCWKHVYYGSAFFRGQVERPRGGLSWLFLSWDTAVIVAISAEGVTVIDDDSREVMLSARYGGLSWDATGPPSPSDPERLPRLFLQFEVSEDGHRVSKVLQVFSKQAAMMDALIAGFVADIRRNVWDRDEVGGVTPQDCTPDNDDVDAPLTMVLGKDPHPDGRLTKRLNRMSLATFDEDGQCIRASGSWVGTW